jgi:hypothetical protein
MKWDELDVLVRKHLSENGISDNDIAWIRIEPDSVAIETIMIGFDNKYAIKSKQLGRDSAEKGGLKI